MYSQIRDVPKAMSWEPVITVNATTWGTSIIRRKMLPSSTGNENRSDERFGEMDERTCQVLGIMLKTQNISTEALSVTAINWNLKITWSAIWHTPNTRDILKDTVIGFSSPWKQNKLVLLAPPVFRIEGLTAELQKTLCTLEQIKFPGSPGSFAQSLGWRVLNRLSRNRFFWPVSDWLFFCLV